VEAVWRGEGGARRRPALRGEFDLAEVEHGVGLAWCHVRWRASGCCSLAAPGGPVSAPSSRTAVCSV
jgi:hypothetical protein